LREEGRLERVQALIDLGRLEDAHTLLAVLLATDPDDAAALRMLAACHYQAGDGHAALTAAERATAADPDDEWAHRLRASALLLLERPRDAMAAAREAIRLDPDHWAAHLLLGVAAASTEGQWHVSRSAFRRAAALAPDEAEIPFVRGQLQHALGATRQARRAYQEALGIDPGHAGALEGLAAIAMVEGNPGESLGYVRSAAASTPGGIASVQYLDRALLGVLGWAVLASWVLLVVLLYAVFPVAWAVAAGVMAAYLLWAWRTARALPPNAAAIAWEQLRGRPRLVVRAVVAIATAVVAVGVGIATSRHPPNLLPVLPPIAAAVVGGALTVLVTDHVVGRRGLDGARAPSPMDLSVAVQAAAKRLAFRCFTATLAPAIVLFGPAVDPDPDRFLRAGLGTALLAGLAVATGWIARHQGTMSAAALAWWSHVPQAGLSALWLGWLVLLAFVLGAAYMPDGSPLVVNVLAVGALVAIGCGVVLVTAVGSVAATRRMLRLLRR
jgi:tetratricopeptide (TPR) repeat protein